MPSSATLMDQLSEALGSLIPGSSHRSPRHPVNVSLVMGALGTTTGWIVFGIWRALSRRLMTINEPDFYWGLPWEISAVSSSVAGLLILVPILLWNKNSWWFSCLGIPVACFARFLLDVLQWLDAYRPTLAEWEEYFDGDPFTWGSVYLAPALEDSFITIFHCAWIALTVHRNVRAMFSISILANLICGPCIQFLWDISWRPDTPWIVEEMAGAALLVGYYLPHAICLGISLWEWPHPAKQSEAPRVDSHRG